MPTIDSIAVLMVDGEGTPSVSVSPIPDNLLTVDELTQRVEVLEGNKYVVHVKEIFSSEIGGVEDHDTEAIYFDMATHMFVRYELGRPFPGAALGYMSVPVEVYEDALFVCGKKVYKYAEGTLIAVGSSLELGVVRHWRRR